MNGGNEMDGEGRLEIDTGGRIDQDGGSRIDIDGGGKVDEAGGVLIDIDAEWGSERDAGVGNRPNEMVPFMTVSKGGQTIETLSLAWQDIFVMGRCSCSADMLVGHATCSRQHLEVQIIHATHEILLTDLCSAHGTWLDGERLPSMTPTLVKDTVTFQLGTSKRVYRIDWQPAPDAPHVGSSDLSCSSVEMKIRELSSPSESTSVLSGLRYSAENQDFLPSAPYVSSMDKFLFPEDVAAAPAAVVVRPCPLKHSPAKHGSGEMRKSMSSPKILFSQDENISPVVKNSPALNKPSQLTRAASSPTSRPMRKLGFSSALQPVPPNAQSPSPSPCVKRPLAERPNSSGSLFPPPHSVSPKIPHSNKQQQQQFKASATPTVLEVTPKTTPSKLWLRRCSSAPLPALATTSNNDPSRPQAPKLAALNEHPESKNGVADLLISGALSPTSSNQISTIAESADDEFSPNKENLDPKLTHSRVSSSKKERAVVDRQGRGATSWTSLTSRGSSLVDREPFRPLHYTVEAVGPSFNAVEQESETIASSASSECSSKGVGLPRPHRHRIPSAGRSKSFTSSGYGSSVPVIMPRPHQRLSSSAVSNLDLLSPSEQLVRKLKMCDNPLESRRQWHIVVDTNCLLDSDSLKALKQLEGIREVDVIIPKIVVRELDCLKQRHGGNSSVRAALKWIASCMVRLPTWIHVQSNLETHPVKATPPGSPTSGTFTQYPDLMSPTNEDHVLECALIFAALKVHHGKVALLTRDVALQIKAMAEGLVSESAPEFCESLLSPYSSRFLWMGSVAHGKTWADQSLPNNPASSRRGKSRASKSMQHLVEDLRLHVKTQPKGLQLVAKLK